MTRTEEPLQPCDCWLIVDGERVPCALPEDHDGNHETESGYWWSFIETGLKTSANRNPGEVLR